VISNSGYWGKGDTLSEALKNCSGSRPVRVTVYKLPHTVVDPASVAVTDYGTVRYRVVEDMVPFVKRLDHEVGRFTLLGNGNLKPQAD
jgi:hypothetical protein